MLELKTLGSDILLRERLHIESCIISDALPKHQFFIFIFIIKNGRQEKSLVAQEGPK
jgi:hypothetical protein